MVPVLNQVLFFFSTLFGIQTVFVAEQTNLTIDFESKIAIIEYLDLKTSTQATEHVEYAEYAEEELRKIDKFVNFNENFSQVKLVSKSFEKKEGELNACITLSFENHDELFKFLRFNLTHYGKQTSSDAFYYHLLHCENLRYSNGIETKQEDITVLKWGKEIKEIRIELTQKENVKDFMGNMKSIAEYWKD